MFSNLPYSYSIVVNDPDLPYGDALSISTASLPAWLSLVDNGDGTATLSGTPTIADAGSITIQLAAEDINHHQSPIPTQTVTINVIPCDFTVSGVTTDLTCAGDASGVIDISLTGDFGTPTFLWSGPNGFAASTEDISNLEAGIYTVLVSSNLGCDRTVSFTVGTTPDVTPPTAIAQNLTVQLDANGSASITVDGTYSVGAQAGTLPTQNSASVVTNQSCNCPSGYVAVGYEGFAGCITDNFRLICKQLNPDDAWCSHSGYLL